jgi:predicted nucleic acid-binding protein
MTVAVVDASVLAVALAGDGPDGDAARTRLHGEDLACPELAALGVTSVPRRQVSSGDLDLSRAELALTDLASMPILRAPHLDLLPRDWQLRDNLSVYDASYVALAEALSAPLLTADRRLAGAPGLRFQVEVF